MVLYKTDFWNAGIKVDGKFNFTKFDDKSVGIDSNASTIMGITKNLLDFHHFNF